MASDGPTATEVIASIRNNQGHEKINLRQNTKILELLLKDNTTGRNITWASAHYEFLGKGFQEFSQITPECITGEYASVIQPRMEKCLNSRGDRTKDHAEVFTPSWVCNHQNNLIDTGWFGRPNVFNFETERGWTVLTRKVEFPGRGRDWKAYVDARRLEVACGEAPYLVSRYDAVTGETIPLGQRVGLLDRKLRFAWLVRTRVQRKNG